MSRRMWIAKVGLVLLIDVALAATGVGLIVAARARESAPPPAPRPTAPAAVAPESDPPTVEVSRPKIVRKGRRKPAVAIPPTATARPVTPTPTPTSTPTPIPPLAPAPQPEAEAEPEAETETGAAEPSDPPAAPPVAAAGPDAAVPPPDDGRADRISEAIRDVVEAHRAQIDRCYERVAKAATRTDPLRGTVTISLSLQPSGAVADVQVAENDTGSDDLASCLASLLAGWKFPSPGDEAIDFLWPFVFRGQ